MEGIIIVLGSLAVVASAIIGFMRGKKVGQRAKALDIIGRNNGRIETLRSRCVQLRALIVSTAATPPGRKEHEYETMCHQMDADLRDDLSTAWDVDNDTDRQEAILRVLRRAHAQAVGAILEMEDQKGELSALLQQ